MTDRKVSRKEFLGGLLAVASVATLESFVSGSVGIASPSVPLNETDPFQTDPSHPFAVFQQTDPPTLGLYFDVNTLCMWQADNVGAVSQLLQFAKKDHTDPSYPFSTPFTENIVGVESVTETIMIGDQFGSPPFLNGTSSIVLLTNPTGSADFSLIGSGGLTLPAKIVLQSAPSGGQVGLPTGSGGIATTLNKGDHRHAFSGRFKDNGYLGLAGNVGLPNKVSIIQLVNAWTLRRIWVRAQIGPVGGTETYAIINAAGTVQGTSVTLAAGSLEQLSALQVTNLLAGTEYYLAQTAVGAGWAAGSTGINIGIEYTMNI
jgi:hypothetical protein